MKESFHASYITNKKYYMIVDKENRPRTPLLVVVVRTNQWTLTKN